MLEHSIKYDFINYIENDLSLYFQDFIEDDCQDDFQDDFQLDNQDDILDCNQDKIHGIPFNNSYEGKEEITHIDNIIHSEIKDSNYLLNHDLKHNIKNKSRKKPKPYHKRKSTLSFKAQCFREMFFLIFTKKKKFPKTIIWEIHKLMEKPLHLLKITRDIIRDNDKYFETFSNESASIIQYLQNNKDQIISLIPRLKDYE